ncbi:MAG: hypothetical protein ABIR53_03910, partial [Paraperlucidibaca sp.]
MSLACPTLTERQAIATARQNTKLCVPLAWGALTLTGADAQSFLQGQLSCDMKLVSAEQANLGCLLNLKGRIEASVIVIASADGYALLMPQEQIASVKARLAKYGAFSKVSISAATYRIEGLLGSKALPDGLLSTPYAVLASAGSAYVRLPGLQRGLKISDTAVLGDDTPSALAAWQAEAIASG